MDLFSRLLLSNSLAMLSSFIFDIFFIFIYSKSATESDAISWQTMLNWFPGLLDVGCVQVIAENCNQ